MKEEAADELLGVEAFTGSFSKKTPPKKTAVSDRWNHYTFKPVLAPTLPP